MNISVEIALLTILILLIVILTIMIIVYFFDVDIKLWFSHTFKKLFKKKHEIEKINTFIPSLSSTLLKLSQNKVGAIIVVENNDSLSHYINVGNKLDSEFFPELVYTIFYNKNSPFHDGAMIIKDWKIASVSSYLPLSKKFIKIDYGARHRAAYGITEKYDCFAFLVSETTGSILCFHLDNVYELPRDSDQIVNQIIKIFMSFNVIKQTNKK